jgi:hypothetical protein
MDLVFDVAEEFAKCYEGKVFLCGNITLTIITTDATTMSLVYPIGPEIEVVESFMEDADDDDVVKPLIEMTATRLQQSQD